VVFLVFMYRDSLGLTLGDLGKVAAVVSVAGVVLSYPAGMLSDRYHPMRVMVWIKFGLVAVTPLNFIWLLRPTWDHATAFLILIGLNAVQLPLGILYDISRQPMQMRVWPKSRYGQFCSFAATAQGVCNIAASSLAGFFMVWMRHLLPDEKYGKDFCYRMIPAWQLPLLVAALILLLLMYREWNKLGGIKNYKVPGFDHETVAAAPEPASGAEVAG
jgi:MFS family permease